jgi:hypothetical protein
MSSLFRFFPPVICSLALLGSFGCAGRHVSTSKPALAFETRSYMVVETSPGKFVILTRSTAAMDEISKRLGCNGQHVCAGVWTGEVWTIERIR